MTLARCKWPEAQMAETEDSRCVQNSKDQTKSPQNKKATKNCEQNSISGSGEKQRARKQKQASSHGRTENQN